MSLIKKIDVEKHFAARRAMKLGRTGLLSRSGIRMKPAAAATNAPTSVQNGVVEHATPSASVVSIAADSGGRRVPAAPRNRQP